MSILIQKTVDWSKKEKVATGSQTLSEIAEWNKKESS